MAISKVVIETDAILLGAGDQEITHGLATLQAVPEHPLALAYVVVVICQQGEAEFEVNFQSYHLKKHDFLVLAEDSIALLKQRSPDLLCSFYLLKRSSAADVAYLLPNHLFSYLNKHPYFAATLECKAFVSVWEQHVRQVFARSSGYRRQMLINAFQNLFLFLSEQADNQKQQLRNDYSRQEMICWKFWEMLSVQCRQHREVAFYADALHITPYYLSQLTKRFFNDSPKTLIDRQVVLEIKKELRQPQHSIQQIADALNFADPSYLGKYFSRHTGMGPTEYRASIS